MVLQGSGELTEAQALQVFDGVMLGDGGLAGPRMYAYLDLALSSGRIAPEELLKHLQHIADVLKVLGVEACDRYPRASQSVSRGKPYTRCRLVTKTSPFLSAQYGNWYASRLPGNTRRKKLPEGLLLTRISLAYWFAYDGSSFRNKRYHSNVPVSLASDGFCTHDVELLEEQLHILEIASTGRHLDKRVAGSSGISITVLQDSVDSFMELVDPYVPEPYRYKIKYKEV